MAAQPQNSPARLRLHPPESFTLRAACSADAARVAGWVCSAVEMFWLAPRTRGPLTPEMVRAWSLGPGTACVLEQAGTPLAYGEINVLNQIVGSYWLGHLIVDPARRGQGVGLALTRALIRRAFEQQRALRVTLVVFPENVAALRCYEAAGMVADGHETHYFPLYRRRERLVRMAIGLSDWLAGGDAR